jgi:hypothetical protein
VEGPSLAPPAVQRVPQAEVVADGVGGSQGLGAISGSAGAVFALLGVAALFVLIVTMIARGLQRSPLHWTKDYVKFCSPDREAWRHGPRPWGTSSTAAPASANPPPPRLDHD